MRQEKNTQFQEANGQNSKTGRMGQRKSMKRAAMKGSMNNLKKPMEKLKKKMSDSTDYMICSVHAFWERHTYVGCGKQTRTQT